ncbi:MAG: hypothetical protein A3F42_03365 [Gammaproteobacteria bacterium RIFCSPHIGHO2_12_FULL_37_34]|nr:MAG: hypothetical protein A3F42_03365 [Gammaproteobacteria bacterium RIFCSPHIGHO2_12_FULL_37_34]
MFSSRFLHGNIIILDWIKITMNANTITVPLTDNGVLKVSGTDAKKFLQGQLTCNMDEITTKESRLAAHCNREGRIISLFYLAYFQEAYYCVMPFSMIALTLAAFKKYAVFYNVSLTDVSEHFSVVGYVSEKAPAINNGFIIKIPSKNRYLYISDTISHHPTNHLSINSWRLLDIANGIPTIYPEISAVFLPHEINLIQLNAISFDKGCYTGQEIIARMHYRGKLKKQLYHAHIICHAIIPIPGFHVYQQKDRAILLAGMIVNACPQEKDNYYTLIVLNDIDADNCELLLKNDQTICFFHDITLVSSTA